MKRVKPDMEEMMPLLIQQWRRRAKLGGPPDVLQTREFRRVVSSTEAMRRSVDFTNERHLTDYLLYHWPLHYQEALSILSELPDTPHRVLDICSGSSPIAFAALKLGCTEVYAVDQNLDALKLGAKVCGQGGFALTVRKWKALKDPLPIEGKFDLITIGYALEELFPNDDKAQQSWLEAILKRLTPQGHLVLIESSQPESNQRVLNIREQFAQKKVPVQAPCVWQGPCPALADHFPCFAQRDYEKPYVMKEVQRALGINLGSLKMSYLILRSPESNWPKLPDKEYFRVVSPPQKTTQGKQFYLCGTPGKRKICSRADTHEKEARAFEYLKRGELISIEDALERHNTLYLKEETKVKVEAACGKPIPEVF